MYVKDLGAGPVIDQGSGMSRPSQTLPYKDGRGGAYPLTKRARIKLVVVGRMEGNGETAASESSKADLYVQSF